MVVVFGVLFALTIQRGIEKVRYGNWQVQIWRKKAHVLHKNISSGKAKAILEIPEDMNVFLKGLISPFATLTCDLVDQGPALGLLKLDRKARRIVIDLDKNLPEDSTSPEAPVL